MADLGVKVGGFPIGVKPIVLLFSRQSKSNLELFSSFEPCLSQRLVG